MSGSHAPSKGDYIRVQGNKQYLPVPNRVQWFRGEHPDWTIHTSVVELDWNAGYAVMRAEVLDDTGRLIASGMKTETRKGFGDFVEKAETGAVGRALARAGYGTEDALDLEGDRYADAPIQQPERGERTPQAGRRAEPESATTPAPAQRSPEEQALADELLALTSGKGREYMEALADEVGVPKGQRANADQLRAMIDRAVERAAIEPAGVSPADEAGAPAEEEVGGSEIPGSDAAAPLPDEDPEGYRAWYDAQPSQNRAQLRAQGRAPKVAA